MDSFRRFLTDINTQPKNRVFIESATRGYNVSNEKNDDISVSYIQFLESLHTEDTALRSAIVEAYIETHVLNEARIMRKLGNTLNKVKNAVSGIGAKSENATDVKQYTQRVLDFIGDINNFKTDSSEYIKELVDKLALMDDDDVKKTAPQIINQIQSALANTIFNSDVVGHDESSPKMFMNNASKEAGKKIATKLVSVLKNTFPHTSQVNADRARTIVEDWWNKNMAAEMGGYRPVFSTAKYKIIKDPNAPIQSEDTAEEEAKPEQQEKASETTESKPESTEKTTTPLSAEEQKKVDQKYIDKRTAEQSRKQADLQQLSPLAGGLYGMRRSFNLSPQAERWLQKKNVELGQKATDGIKNVGKKVGKSIWNKVTGKGKPVDDTLTPIGTPTQQAQPAPVPNAQPAPVKPVAQPTPVPNAVRGNDAYEKEQALKTAPKQPPVTPQPQMRYGGRNIQPKPLQRA